MTDSSWQHAVLRDIGVSRRGFQVLDGVPGSPAQGSWGAEAPPRPAREQRPAAAPVPQSAPQPVPDTAPAAQAAPEVPPFAPPAEPSPAESQNQVPLLPEPQPASPQPPAPSPQPSAQPPAQPPAPVAPPPPVAPQPTAAQQGADVPGEPQRLEPLISADFDWESAVNPVLGGVSSGGDAAQQGDGAAPADAAAGPAPPAPVHPGPPGPPGQQGVPGQQGAHQAGQAPPADDLVRRNQHGDPLARRMGRGVRNAMGGGAREARERAAFADLMQRPVPSSRQIAIASVRGGAGKTTMAALVATELARHRSDRVLAADADAELGSLPLRLGVRPHLSLFDLAAQNPNTFQEAEAFLTRTRDGLYVLSSTRGGRIAGEFALETFQAALSTVSRYVAATVIDCGAGILTEVNRGVVASSHGLVLVTPGTVDGALSARGALEWYAANDQRGLLGRTVIAMVSHAPQVGADLQRAHQMLSAWGLPVVFVPYDRQLATGSSVDMSKVSAAARTAVTRIVHEVFARALGAGGQR